MPFVFISYSHKDKRYAHRLEKTLEQKGFEVWLDDRIDYGSEWPKRIQKYLDDCTAMILIMTAHSYGSDWVQSELARAKRKKKYIFPLLLQGDEPWLSVEALQYVDVRSGNLPPTTFYHALAKVVPKKGSTRPKKESGYLAMRKLGKRDRKINEIITKMIDLKSRYGNRHLMVGNCLVIYHSKLFLASISVKNPKIESQLVDLGWRYSVTDSKGLRYVDKHFKEDDTLQDIADFLINSLSLFSIRPSKIDVVMKRVLVSPAQFLKGKRGPYTATED